MLLALLSDTHDNEAMTRAALALLKPYKPEAYLHAGDLVSPSMLGLFAGLPFHFVYGNNEWDLTTLKSRARAEGMHCHEMAADLVFAGKRIAIVHGHEQGRLERLCHSGDYAYVIHGHTHVRKDVRVGTTRVINPGAVHRARVKSVALLDVAHDELRYLELDGTVAAARRSP
jgi:putative phosphoesterase